MPKLPRLVTLGLAILLLHLLLLGAARLAFWAYFDNANNPVPLAELFTAVYVGGKFDLRLILITLLPLLILGGIGWFSPFRGNWQRRFWLGYLALVFAIILLFYMFDFGHYAYLTKPLDATILRFAVDFDISMGMMWQTYPVLRLVGAILLLTAGYAWLMHHLLLRVNALTPWRPSRKKRVFTVALMSFLVIFGLYGKFSYYPLRWSDAFSTPHPFTPAVTLNPVLYFFDTLKNKEITYSEERTRDYYDRMTQYLGIDQPDKARLNFRRENRQPGPLAEQRPNIVLVLLESFATYKTGLSGNPLDPTPNIDRLAGNGVFFSHFYTPHTGTARSVFTYLTGIPDIELNRTSSRNPLIVEQHTLINAFTGYDKLYFLGGSANWGNIRGILSHNIPGLRVYEEGSYRSPRVDVWGISDLHLFEEANEILARQDKPFFAMIQTSGNHRPYTIPEDNRGFEFDHRDDDELAKHGFISNAEYNSFRYMDHSVGHFMQLARKADYFDNTIFVFFGDHGISGYGGRHTPDYKTHFDLTSLQVPFVLYAPKLLEARRIDRIASEMDVLPTLAGLAAPGYTNTTLGRDLLDPRFDDQRYAFTTNHARIPRLGLLGRDFYFGIRADGDQPQLHDIRGENFAQDVREAHPDVARQMRELTLGIYESAKYLRHHNPNSLAAGH